ncbi:hypothetical protein [Arenibacterium halophilum]|uniref:Antitoxin Xre/MbcA/ParS-like toxin-binding domain-containing protein n=1 Tax=Arenibacterium halophilum TaxID=2583821 RepID=A0ABY2XD11_9RHOB|nr:hypothetical protein [Arenibacterium halophilum]TMV14914.1 hypothetical protein FGK64_02740 [Arenibacterium halophilum]
MSEQDIPSKMIEASRQFGVSSEQMEQLSSNSQVVADLGIWGDDFDEFYHILSQVYDSDHLIPAECIPSEFAWMRTLKGWLPFTNMKDAAAASPLSLAQLDMIMRGERSKNLEDVFS